MSVKISVIVPIYNNQKYLSRCIDSILKQTFLDYEIILINDGSTDNTEQICNKYINKHKNIKYIKQEHKGQGAARNNGLEQCKGEYITFVDSDDYVSEKYLETLYSFAITNKCDLCVCDYKITKKYSNQKNTKQPYATQLSKDDAFKCLFRIKCEKDYFAVWGKLYKKELINKTKFVENKINEDIIFAFEILEKSNKIIFVNEILYYYFYNINGITHKPFTKEKLDLLDVWDIINKKVEESYPQYTEYSKINVTRARYTLLAKMCLEKYDKNNTELYQIYKQLKQHVKKNYFDLLKINMSLKRKILLTLLVI